VLRLQLFQMKPAAWESHWIEEIRRNPPDFVFFRQSVRVDGFLHVMGPEAAHDVAARCNIVAADEATERSVRCKDLAFSADKNGAFLEILGGVESLDSGPRRIT